MILVYFILFQIEISVLHKYCVEGKRSRGNLHIQSLVWTQSELTDGSCPSIQTVFQYSQEEESL